MENKWEERLRLISFLNRETREYELRQMPEELPMPRAESRIYENREGLLFAVGRKDGKRYTDILRVSDFNSNTIYDWIPLENPKIISSLSDTGKNYFEDEELDFGDDENFEDDGNFFEKNFQGAD